MTARIVPRMCSSGTDAMLHFFTSSLDVAYLGLVPFSLGRLFGLPLVALEPCGHWTEAVCIDRPPSGTGPVRVATVFGSNAHFLGWEWAHSEDREVVFVDLDPPEQVRALQLGLVDAICVWEPYVSMAVRSGAAPIWSSQDLSFEVTDILCGAAGSIAARPALVERFRAIHRAGSEELARGVTGRSADILSSLVGVHLDQTWSDTPVFPAPEGFTSRSTDALQVAVQRVEGFLRKSGLAGSLPTSEPPAWMDGPPSGEPDQNDELIVGYSEDPMCSPFYLAQVDNMFLNGGLQLEVPKDREGERIARLADDMREEVLMIQQLVPKDPELAVMKTGRVLERELLRLYQAAFSTSPPHRVSEVLRSLEDSEVLPPLLASSADWIRKVRNVATHGEGASPDVARKTFLELLEFLEWVAVSQGEIAPHCGRCKAKVDPSWRSCPNCTAELTKQCPKCGRELQSDWKLCPSCG